MSRDGCTLLVPNYGLERFATQTDGETTDYRYDILGNLRHTRDADGTATATFQYDPWGNPEQGDPAPFGFTGELHDQGLVHLRARWYHPQHGTFTTIDPFPGIGNVPASQHPYQYALNSPMRFTDPSGEIVPALLGAIAAGAIIGGLVEYGGQMVEQHRTTGSIDWGAYCRDEVIIAALGGGVAGGVGFLMGPMGTFVGRLGSVSRLGFPFIEGLVTGTSAQVAVNLARGQAWNRNLGLTAQSELRTTAAFWLVGRAFGGVARGGWRGAFSTNEGVLRERVLSVADGGRQLDEDTWNAIAQARWLQHWAQIQHKGLGKSYQKKTVAEAYNPPHYYNIYGHFSTLSGWSHDVGYLIKTTDDVLQHAQARGYQFPVKKLLDQGVPGRYHASHAELQAYVFSPNSPIGVWPKDQCWSCQLYFRDFFAPESEKPIVVASQYTRVFHPDGWVTLVDANDDIWWYDPQHPINSQNNIP